MQTLYNLHHKLNIKFEV